MKRNSYIANTIKDLNKFSRMLKEAYAFEDDDMGYDEEPMGDDMDEEPIDDEEAEMESNHQTDEIIDQIRMLALKGIEVYAKDVDNEMYITYKKIWMMCDKCLSEKDKVEN